MSGSSGEILEVIVDVVGRLEKAEIPHMISGSIAANIYAEPRFTNDIDIRSSFGARRLNRSNSCLTSSAWSPKMRRSWTENI